MSTDTVPTDRPDDATAILRPQQPGEASSANMTTTTTDAAPPRRGYGALWARVPREFGFLILTMPIAIIGLVVLATVFFTGLGLVTIFVGIFLMVAAFYIARGFGTLELIRLRWAGRPEIRRPAWGRDGREQGFWRIGVRAVHRRPLLAVPAAHARDQPDRQRRHVEHHDRVDVGRARPARPAGSGSRSSPTGDRTFWLNEWLVDRFLPGNDLAYDPVVGERILEVLLGLVFLATLPFVFRGLTLLHDVIARGVLGAWRSEALEVEVAQLAASRGAAVQAEDASLRRLERDIHDGPQQRLVRLQMDLATIERRLEQDPDSAKALVGEAREQAREALDELRALSRGFAPPILQDRGLAAGLESLASRSPVPVIVEVDLADAALPAPIERNAYFIAAELLTNAAKHAAATAIRLRVGTRDEGAGGPLDRRLGHRQRSRRRRADARARARRPRRARAGPPRHARDRQPRGRADHDRRARAVRAARGIRNRGRHGARRGLSDVRPTAPTLPRVGAVVVCADRVKVMTDAARRPLRIVLAEDSVLLREGLVRLFDEAGFETVGSYGDADGAARRDRADRARPRGARRADAADVPRRGRARRDRAAPAASEARRAAAQPVRRGHLRARAAVVGRGRHGLPAEGPRRVARRARGRGAARERGRHRARPAGRARAALAAQRPARER